MMERHTTFSFTLVPTAVQAEALRKHVGAARFAFNQCLRLVEDALAAKTNGAGASNKVPWSGFDLINAFNAWKLTEAAGRDEAGNIGLPWRNEVCQQVFEESAVDLGRALAAFTAGRNGQRRGEPPRFPRYKKKSSARPSFRLRSKGSGERASIRVGVGGARMIRLPKLGDVRVRECTRRLRRMVRRGRARILFATVSFQSDGRWRVTLNVEAAALHPALRHPENVASSRAVGVDRGLMTFAVVADSAGEIARFDSPRPLRRMRSMLRARSKDVSRKEVGSRNRRRARAKLAKTHARISSVRRDFLHKLSTQLVKIHGHLVIEDLCTAGMMKTRLARSVADSAWGLFGSMLTYKASWYGATLVVADRFFPSTRRCSACGILGDKLDLSDRLFRCSRCGHAADRDTNAAVNLANYSAVVAPGQQLDATSRGPRSQGTPEPHVAAKHAETQNVCGEESSGARHLAERETPLVEAERASAQRPRRAVLR